jgi:uncharacterized protein
MKRIYATTIILLAYIVFCSGCMPKASALQAKDPFPLSIDALRKYVFTPSEITIEKNVARTPSYTSTIVSYKSDGLKLFAMMYTPVQDTKDKKIPVVIVNHGYIPPNRYSTVTSYHDVSAYYASCGFIVFKPDYRGHAESEGKTDSPFNSIYYSIDVLNLIEAIRTFPAADMTHLFMYGHSMGGEVTLRVLEVTDAVKAATLWAPVSAPFPENTLFFIRKLSPDATKNIESAIAALIGPRDYDSLSPLYYTRYIKIPILLQHGTADESVPYSWSLKLTSEFAANNVKYTFYTYEGENHNLAIRSYATVKKRDVEFFMQFLK